MSDGFDPKEAFMAVEPEHLLTDEQVQAIINTIPDRVHQTFLIAHMRASEKKAYEDGLMASKEDEIKPDGHYWDHTSQTYREMLTPKIPEPSEEPPRAS